VLLVVITFTVNFKSIINIFGEGVILAAAIIIMGAFCIGYLFGGPDIAAKDVLGLGTAQRNIGAATVVATQGFENRDTLIVVVLTSLLGLLILFPIAILLRKREKKKLKINPEDQEGLL
jgi:BASS family bile acid:Na+ symporter